MYLHILESPRTFVLEQHDFALILNLQQDHKVAFDFQPTVDYTRLIDLDLEEHKPLQVEIEGCLGVIELQGLTFLIVLLESELASVPSLPLNGAGVEPVRRVRKVGFFCLDHDMDSSAKDKNHPCHLVRKILQTGNFYYSSCPKYDLTSRLDLRLSRANGEHKTTFAPLARKDRYPARTPPQTSFECDAMFTYNWFILAPLLQARQRMVADDRAEFDSLGFVIPLIQGFFGQKAVEVNGEDALLTIISRLCPNRSGTRLKRRGIDDKGEVANCAETETIIRTVDEVFSFVQIRGSAPFYWKEKLNPSRVNVDIAPLEKSLYSFQTHFYHLFDTYRVVHCLNLMRDTPPMKTLAGEDDLCNMYLDLVNAANEEEEEFGTKLGWQGFDVVYVEETCGGVQGVPEKLKEAVYPIVKKFGATIVSVHSDDGCLDLDNIIQRQEGIFRVNCRDCLDRTNMVKQLNSSFAVDEWLASKGLAPMSIGQAGLLQAHRELYAKSGDTLSIIYTGAGALFSIFTETGVQTSRDLILNAEKSAKRIYCSKVTDIPKQEAINELTGKWLHKRDAWVVECEPFQEYVLRSRTRPQRPKAT
ncbi:hypothetical protein T439DRAFT_25285 [Meredithblackwellia eburnea MCA 4105]